MAETKVTSTELDGTTVVRRQNITTNSTTSARIETGWGYLIGNSTGAMTNAITFGLAFSTVPIVTVTFAGYNSSIPVTNAGNLQDNNSYSFSGQGISTSGFTLNMFRNGATFANTLYYVYNWIAIGA